PHRFTEYRKSLLADFVGRNVVRTNKIAQINLRAWHECIDLDRVSRCDLQRRKFLVFDWKKLIFPDFVPAGAVGYINDLARLGIDELILEAVAGLTVELHKGEPLVARGGMQRDRTGNE